MYQVALREGGEDRVGEMYVHEREDLGMRDGYWCIIGWVVIRKELGVPGVGDKNE